MNQINFKGPAKRIEDWDIGRMAHMLKVNEDIIHAVKDVEASSSGFDSQGRPKILYEPHVFYRNLPSKKIPAAVRAGLACEKWGQLPYGKESEQYVKLERAMLIDQTAALKSCSWGMAQILGENFSEAGYPTVQDMVVDFTLDEDNHLEAMVRFIIAAGLDDELRALNWAAFARGYNGPLYARNKYDVKLAARYAWWRTKPDTPYDPATDPDLVVIPPPRDVRNTTIILTLEDGLVSKVEQK